MKDILIDRTAGQWQFKTGGRKHGVVRHDDRAYLLRHAAAIAKEHGGRILVYDDGGHVEAIFSYQNGWLVEVTGRYRRDLLGDLGIARPGE